MSTYGEGTYGSGLYGEASTLELLFTELAHASATTPGAGSVTTASLSPTAGRDYLVFVTCIRGGSANPDSVTVTGWSGQTFTDFADILWTSTGTNRRRSQAFKCALSGSPAAGSLTISYTNTPTRVQWTVLEVENANDDIVVATNVFTNGTGLTANVLSEPIVMNAPVNSDNRFVSYAAENVTGSMRLELLGDTGGDASWTTGSFVSSTTPSVGTVWGYLPASGSTDLTPGVMPTASASAGRIVFEVGVIVTGPASIPLAGAATPSSAGTAAMIALRYLTGDTTPSSSGLAALDVAGSVELAGAATPSSSGVSEMTVLRPLAGAATPSSAGTGAMIALRGATGTSGAISSAIGDLDVLIGDPESFYLALMHSLRVTFHSRLRSRTWL